MSHGRALTPLLRHVTELAARGARSLRHLERSGRFLSGLSEFEPRSDDVFISSYPRSGTTWLQLIVHLLLRGGGLEFAHINAVVPWFERDLALGRATAADFARLPSPRAFKSHLPRRFLPRLGRYVYVCRNGLDVLESYFAFYRSHLGFTGDFDSFFERFVQGRVQYRSWFAHVAAWRRHQADPAVLWLSYETLRDAPADTIARVADFLGVPLTPERSAEIARLSSIESMRAHESLFDHAEHERAHARVVRGQFVREGRVGHGEAQLSPAQRATFEAHLRRRRTPLHRMSDLPAFLH